MFINSIPHKNIDYINIPIPSLKVIRAPVQYEDVVLPV